MSLEHSPAKAANTDTDTAVQGGAPSEGDLPYWHSLIDEKEAGDFLGLTARTMQAMRQRGGGCRYIAVSARCIRYRRLDLRAWSEARLRTSTSDPGREAA